MTSFKKTLSMLTIALGLLGAACGDDTQKKVDQDAGTDSGMVVAGECVGGYSKYTIKQITDNIKIPTAACANAADIEGICKLDPADKAREVGLPCFLGVAGDDKLTDEQKAEQTGECAFNGKGELVGLKTMLSTMSEGCISCYVDAVTCAALRCTDDCGTGTAEECSKCRDEQKCTSEFFTCAGIPSDAEIEAAK